MIIQKITKNNTNQLIKKTAEILRSGGLVVFPSDTVYGLLVDSNNEDAVRKLIAFKNRPPGKAISVFACDLNMLKENAVVNDGQLKTIKQLLPGPYTLILDSRHKVSGLLESEKGSLGLRIPNFPLIKKLVKAYGRPLTATSANLSNRSPHYSIKSFIKDLPKQKTGLIDLIIDAGKLPYNKPSTVIDLTEDKIKVIRQGDAFHGKPSVYLSNSPMETEKIAKSIIKGLDFVDKTKPVVVIIEGELGVGKTIFVKGIGRSLGVNDIVSPSFVIFYEYLLVDHYFDKLIHFDLYNLQGEEELKYLYIDKYLKKGNLLCFEWGEKIGHFFENLKKTATVVYIKMEYLGKDKRKLEVKNLYDDRRKNF